jgi:hypothetical protein
MGAAKAWPLSAFEGAPVINDHVGDQPVVVIATPNGDGVRAYARQDQSFETAQPGMLLHAGQPWQQTEEALIGPDGTRLARLPGHLAYWFAWSDYGDGLAELYQE